MRPPAWPNLRDPVSVPRPMPIHATTNPATHLAEATHFQAFGPRPDRRDHAHPGDRLPRQRPRVRQRRTRRRPRARQCQAGHSARRRQPRVQGRGRYHPGSRTQLRRPSAARAICRFFSDAQAAAAAQFSRIRQFSVGSDQANLDAIERTFARLQGNFPELSQGVRAARRRRRFRHPGQAAPGRRETSSASSASTCPG